MKERPMLMSAPMVRAALEGHKTQTRRIVKNVFGHPQLLRDGSTRIVDCIRDVDGWPSALMYAPDNWECCPYGVVGDRLWVREAWGVGTRPCPFEGWRDGIEYRADEFYLADDIEDLQLYSVNVPDGIELDSYRSNGWRPSIHMPRWASRIDLEITGVRVERLQSISHDDACAEGIELTCGGFLACVDRYRALWESINGAGSWQLNPWVWVVEFKRVQQ